MKLTLPLIGIVSFLALFGCASAPPAGNYPAWTAIGGIVLLAPGAVVEMRVVAVAGAGKSLKVDYEAHPQAPPNSQ